jgi:Coenzyme PQQ synthesis protein D (PqqD)
MRDDLRGAILAVPDHVVRREFPAETVVLNIKTGHYHGLNPTAARMLAAVEELGRFDPAVDLLADELDESRDRVSADLSELCAGLLERGLLERLEAE